LALRPPAAAAMIRMLPKNRQTHELREIVFILLSF
jgi:hypothetical protein